MSHHRKVRLAAGFSGLALAAGLVAGPTGAASAATEAATDYGRDAFAATNDVRDNRDRRELRHHACLEKYAVRQARRMAERQEIWHQDLQQVARDCHMSWVGENVAAGFPSGTSVVKDGWMKSEGHRENILDRKFRRVEVAARKGDDRRWYAAQVFGRPA